MSKSPKRKIRAGERKSHKPKKGHLSNMSKLKKKRLEFQLRKVTESKTKQHHCGKFVTAEDKAKETLGIKTKGRITFKQYISLVELGLDGDKIKGWTSYHAQKEIEKRL